MTRRQKRRSRCCFERPVQPGRGVFLVLAALVCGSVGLAAAAPPAIDPMIAVHHWTEAEKAVRAELKAEPKNADDWLLLGRILFLSDPRHRTDEAISALERAKSLRPDDAEVLFWLGRACGYKAQHGSWMDGLTYAGRVKAAFETAVKLKPHNFQYAYALVQFYLQAPGFVGGGADHARAFVAGFDGGKGVPHRLLLVSIFIAERKLADAAAALDVIHDPSSLPALQASTWSGLSANLAFRRMDAKEYDRAEDRFRQLTRQFPNYSTGWYGLGNCLRTEHKLAEAADAYKRAVKLGGHPQALYFLGVVEQALKRPADAERAFTRFLAAGASGSRAGDARERLKALQLAEKKKTAPGG